MKKKVVFIHFLTGERDGVSLEIEKRAQVFRDLGCEVSFISGHDGQKREEAYIIPELDIKSNVNIFLREAYFSKKIFSEDIIISLYYHLEHIIFKKFDEAFQKLKPDLVFIHNVLSIPLNLSASTALIKILDKYQTKSVIVNHDFWFQRYRFLNPEYPFIKEILTTLHPQRNYVIKHQVINSQAYEELKVRRNIEAEKIGDHIDFHAPLPTINAFNQTFKKKFGIHEQDLVVLQATRILDRKAIENAMYFVYHLEHYLKEKAPIEINGKIFTETNRVILFFNNFVEVDSMEYFKKLRFLAEQLKIKAIFAGDKFQTERREVKGVKKYSFWDAYLFADLVTYPSILEGFGNQFLEAIYFKKLPVVFEYEVFIKDIKPEGYQYISLGNTFVKENGFNLVPEQTIRKAVEESVKALQNPTKLREITDNNFKIAAKHHDENLLVKDLGKLLKQI